MPRRFIDLSVPLDADAKEPYPPSVRYEDHAASVERAASAFGISPEDWPERQAWAVEELTLTTHTGTHVDAPYHYWYKTGDRPARTIDELPLEWFFGPGVVFDFSYKKRGEEITRAELVAAQERIGHALAPGEIVLIRTDCDKHFFEPGYGNIHPGMSADGTRYLIERGIKVMGTDAYGWDVPFAVQGEQYRQTGDPSVIWAAHYVGKELEYCQIEKLANLDQLPAPTGFTVAAFPVKIARASAGWARPVAIIEE